MKFKKFVKALGTDGIIYERQNGERWLSGGNVFMKVPEHFRSITASKIEEMPVAMEDILDGEHTPEYCELSQAVMPLADGKIKDCIRVYLSEETLSCIRITNDAYSLLERGDITEMFRKFATDDPSITHQYMSVSRILPTGEKQIVGLILSIIKEHK